MQLLSQIITPAKAKSILTRRYIAALGLVALLAIIGQVLIQFALYTQEKDGRIINIAGRQRMYSQRIAKAALAAQNANTVEEQWRHFEDIERTALDFKQSHEGLQHGDTGLELPGQNSVDVAHMFGEMEPYHQAIYESAMALHEEWTARKEQAPDGGVLTFSPEAKEHVDRIQANERAFLPRMNDIVFQYEKEAQARVGWLRWTELTLLMTTLIVLLLEALFVFKPAVEKARNALGTVLSINDRLKQTNSDLSVAQERAQEAIRVKSAFLANMSHELRTPLSGVLGMISLLLETPLDAKQQAFARTIRMGGESTLEIINEVLSFSKLESGTIELEQSPLSPNTCIEETLEVVATQAAWKNIELASFVDERVPSLILGDQVRLAQVLTHLVSNAIKFTLEGSVAITAEARLLEGTQHEIHFMVSDTGIGVAEEEIESVFKPFHQADISATRQYGGTGLGLAICKKLVEAMGGQIWLESTVGQGSTFHFTLPAQAVAIEKADVRGGNPSRLADKRILILDGNQISRHMLARQLRAWQIEVLTASALSEAAAYIESGEPLDLCIANENTLGLSGPELVGKIRVLGSARDLPLVLLHAAGHDAATPDLPLTTSLAKPIRRALLRLTLGRFTAEEAPSPKAEAEPAQAAAAAAADEADPSTLRVLLAEDNMINQEVGLQILNRLGHRTDVVENGLQALEALEQHAYDVVLMDIQMPEMDGLEATRRIRARRSLKKRPWIIAVTANALPEDRARCLEAGMDDYIAKPITLESLRRMLERTPHSPSANQQTSGVSAQNNGQAGLRPPAQSHAVSSAKRDALPSKSAPGSA